MNTMNNKILSNTPLSYWVLSFPFFSVWSMLAIILRKGTKVALTNPCLEHTEGFRNLGKAANYFNTLLHWSNFGHKQM